VLAQEREQVLALVQELVLAQERGQVLAQERGQVLAQERELVLAQERGLVQEPVLALLPFSSRWHLSRRRFRWWRQEWRERVRFLVSHRKLRMPMAGRLQGSRGCVSWWYVVVVVLEGNFHRPQALRLIPTEDAPRCGPFTCLRWRVFHAQSLCTFLSLQGFPSLADGASQPMIRLLSRSPAPP
jgi:hypothetical protein